MGIVELILGLHDVVERQPFQGGLRALVHRHRIKADVLIVCDVPPAFALPNEQLRVKAPGYDRINDGLVAAVHVDPFGNSEELAVTSGETCPS